MQASLWHGRCFSDSSEILHPFFRFTALASTTEPHAEGVPSLDYPVSGESLAPTEHVCSARLPPACVGRMAANFGLDDDVMREALGLRRRGAVNYAKEQVIPEDPAPARRRKKAAPARGGSRAKEAPKGSRRRSQANSDGESSDNDDGSDGSDSDSDFRANRSRGAGGKGRKKQAQRRSERSFLAQDEPSRSIYKEASTDGSEDDSDHDVKRRRKAAESDVHAPAVPQSVIEKLLAQREAKDAGEGEEGEGQLEYLAKIRSKCAPPPLSHGHYWRTSPSARPARKMLPLPL
jgi:hypothetical protein